MTNPSSHQEPPARKTLSCTNCRRRKIKCDKINPCSPCSKYDLECVYPTRRPRLPRTGGDDPEERDVDLLRRIRRLEGMLANRSSGSRILLTPLPRDGQSGKVQAGVPVDDHYAGFVKQQHRSSRHINTEFWSTLGDENGHLRWLVERVAGDEDEDEDEDDIDGFDTPPREPADSLPNLIFQDSLNLSESPIIQPPAAQVRVLLQIYFTNVDPVFKILHRPTATTYGSNLHELVDLQTERLKYESLEAVTFAVYLAAINTMTSEECEMQLLESKDILMARYKYYTKRALVRADFLNSLEIPTLQAFVIYVVVQRSLAQAKSTWTLIGLAIRIAQGIGLHKDGDGRKFSAFEAEMRRRLWWCILSLEMRASEDQGIESTLSEDSFNTVMPCNLNDEDFSYDSHHPLLNKNGPTEMTLALLAMDALSTTRKINFRSARKTLSEMEDLVKQFTERVESTYLVGYDFSDNRQKLQYVMGHFWCCKLWLNVYYPLQRPTHPTSPHAISQGLQRAERTLSLTELVERHPSSAGFIWLFKSYAPWHAVAVMLSELHTWPRDPLAERAWDIIESRFQDWNERVADVKEGMLWGRLKRLRKHAQISREDALKSTTRVQESSTSTYVNDGLENSALDPQMDLMDDMMDMPANFLSINTIPSSTEESAPIPVDNWMKFIYDIT